MFSKTLALLADLGRVAEREFDRLCVWESRTLYLDRIVGHEGITFCPFASRSHRRLWMDSMVWLTLNLRDSSWEMPGSLVGSMSWLWGIRIGRSGACKLDRVDRVSPSPRLPNPKVSLQLTHYQFLRTQSFLESPLHVSDEY